MKMTTINKSELFEQLIARLNHLAERAENGRRDAQDNANEHAGRLESRYDTFKEEAQFLASGQQHRHAAITGWILDIKRLMTFNEEVLEPADVACAGAVVSLAFPGEAMDTRFLLAPAGGGEILESGGEPVEVLNLGTPLGRALIGARAGQSVPLGSPDRCALVLEVS
jgi:hypothetical protein